QVLEEFHQQRQALSRFFIGAVVLSEPVLSLLRRELRRLFPDVKVQNDQVQSVLLHEVLKRDVVEGEKAEEAKRKVNRSALKAARRSAVDEIPSMAELPSGPV